MGAIRDAIEDREYDLQRKCKMEHAKKHGPPLLEKVNSLLYHSNVYSARVEQKQRELREAILMWMYEQGALTEK